MKERMKKIVAEERKVLRYNLLVLLVQIAMVMIAIIFTGEYMLSLYDLSHMQNPLDCPYRSSTKFQYFFCHY